jgi:hypothetical protein
MKDTEPDLPSDQNYHSKGSKATKKSNKELFTTEQRRKLEEWQHKEQRNDHL